jgi:excisionase family DNA binding protein
MERTSLKQTSPSLFPIVSLIKKEMRGDFTIEEGELIINHIIMLMKPSNVNELLVNLKLSIHNISEVLITAILNYQLNDLAETPVKEKEIDSRLNDELTIKEVCELMKISRPTFNTWRKKGLIVSNVGSRVFVSRSDLNKFIQKHKS